MSPEDVQLLLRTLIELEAEAQATAANQRRVREPAQYYDGRASAYKQAAQHVRIAAGLEDA